MKLIINTVNLQIGGAFQRSVSFLNELKTFGEDDYYVFYNENIKKQIKIEEFPENFKFYYFENSPASLKFRKKIVSQFNKLESEINPDTVFSFVGPAYWRPKKPHLVGFGVPHIVYDDYKYVKQYSLKTKLEMVYKKFWTKKEADYYVVQTEDVRKRLAQRLKISVSKVFLVSNGFGEQYKNVEVLTGNHGDTKKLLMISTYRPSKNFEIINEIIPYLKNQKFKYEFHITIKDEDYKRVFDLDNKEVVNHGHVFAKDCPALYNECDAMFLPSFLECFSASYPEAMKMRKPILTSDLSFASTVCGDAALYFNNQNPKEIAQKIIDLFNDENAVQELIAKGDERLKIFDTSRMQAEKYIDICKKITKNDI
ncbi:glycosyltransferase [Flavobacterium sp. GA093]|uniref:Glycosyltransferase n=1 Tax=Flavobacterium hydrocarbonoxydans TaxID=2683249 RepID=A0A6I4NS35_9FLAO|nr:glycosyltransferase [Flavobacterium hydrocarbonoxydans]MWB94489.1 glycosyltransferase [Flavobacterium hydrocarbonoxydans]